MGLPWTVILRILTATLLWGTAFPVSKFALQSFPPIAMAGLRFALAGTILLVLSLIVEAYRSTNRSAPDLSVPAEAANWPRVLTISFLSTFMFYGLFFLGIHRTTASSGAVADGAGPIINAILAHFVLHNDRLTLRKAGAIALAFSGVCTVAFARASNSAGADPLGCGLILAGLCFGASGTMLVVKYRGRFGLMRLTGAQMLIGGSLLLLVSLLVEPSHSWRGLRDPRFLVAWLWLALVSAVAFRIWYGVVREYKVTSVAVFSFLTSLWGTTLSVLVLKEAITMPLVVGQALVVSAVLLMYGGQHTHRREEDAEPAT